MRWSDLIGASLASLRQRPFRTALTVLGVLIGTTAVIVMVSLGIGMSSSYLDSVATNDNLRRVSVTGVPQDAFEQGLPTQLTDAMVTHLGQWPGVTRAAPIYSVELTTTVGSGAQWLSVTGMPRESIEALGLDFAWGGVPAQGDGFALVLGHQVPNQYWDESVGTPVVVDLTSQTVFAELAGIEPEPAAEPDGPAAAPPKRFIVPVAGVLKGGDEDWGPQSMAVYADLDALRATLEKLAPGKPLPNQPATSDGRPMREFVYQEIRLDTAGPEEAEAVLKELRAVGFDAYAEVEWIKDAQRQATLVQAVLGGIGFISLLVAAIGIANTMMMSVYERTREIGVMKVLGASLRDIRAMFVVESAAIGMLGGVVGMLFSLGISALLNAFLGETLGSSAKISVVPPWLMLGAVAFATAIGTLAGLAPAHRAVRLSPLEAIRSQ